MTSVALLGSTGSIGTQAVDVIAREPDRFEIVAIGASSSVDALAEQARAVAPRIVAIADASRATELQQMLPEGVTLLAGPDAMAEAAVSADVAVNGVVGFAGLSVTLAVLAAGKRLALANKESLIAAGPVVQPLREHSGRGVDPGGQRALRGAHVPASRGGDQASARDRSHRVWGAVPRAPARRSWRR